MPGTYNHPRIFTLLEITKSIQSAFQKWYPGTFWIVAEMNKLNYYPHSGHCYPDLVERVDGKIAAQIRANIWADDYNRINREFRRVIQEPLKDGINILFQAKVSFHPLYGLSLHISHIDPSYTLGDLEREKKETIQQLKSEGFFDLNKSHRMAQLPQRIAVISVETSKGFADFSAIIDKNPNGYCFFIMLFPALLQGDQAADSILAQFNRIRKAAGHFDAVAIIRGGGGDVGLSVYNQYRLAVETARFPIPVLTGIGHSTNETVTEMVAWKNFITPTDLANFLIQQFHEFAGPVMQAEKSLKEWTPDFLGSKNLEFTTQIDNLRSNVRNLTRQYSHSLVSITGKVSGTVQLLHAKEQLRITFEGKRLVKYSGLYVRNKIMGYESLKKRLNPLSMSFLNGKQEQTLAMEKQVRLLHPENILRRGFSITRQNGKVITDAALIADTRIETTLYKGKIISKIISTENRHEQENNLQPGL